MFRFSKKNHLEKDENQKRESLFFHDIINHTHGLLLFLNQRQTLGKDIKSEEIKIVESEIRALQSLIKDHFHLKHKNLSSTYDWVPFSVAENSLSGLIQTYLPAPNVQTFIHLKGALCYDKSLEERKNALIYFPTFYRIMNNLIKNMAEAKSTEVHFYFDYSEDYFTIETRNKFNEQKDLDKISDKLSQLILNEKALSPGLGLESIHHLALESGGVFDFEVAHDMWINRISLPRNPRMKDQKKAA